MGAAEITGLVLSAAVLVLGVLALRRLRLLRQGGIDVAVRRGTRGWVVGVGHYRGERFLWYRVLALRGGPDLVLRRGKVEIVDRRVSAAPEAAGLPETTVILRCIDSAGEIELAMGPDAGTGFLSWLESAPPGWSLPYAS
jgi:hypothetical protein